MNQIYIGKIRNHQSLSHACKETDRYSRKFVVNVVKKGGKQETSNFKKAKQKSTKSQIQSESQSQSHNSNSRHIIMTRSLALQIDATLHLLILIRPLNRKSTLGKEKINKKNKRKRSNTANHPSAQTEPLWVRLKLNPKLIEEPNAKKTDPSREV